MQEKTTEDQYLINDKKKTKMEIRSVARWNSSKKENILPRQNAFLILNSPLSPLNI